jgi:hypothetical protein
LEGFSVPPLLEPGTEITIQGASNNYGGNFAKLTLKQHDEAFRKAILNALTERIASLLAEQFAEKTSTIDLTGFEISNQRPKEESDPEEEPKPRTVTLKVTKCSASDVQAAMLKQFSKR